MLSELAKKNIRANNLNPGISSMILELAQNIPAVFLNSGVSLMTLELGPYSVDFNIR